MLIQLKSSDLKFIDAAEPKSNTYLNNELKSIDSEQAEFLSSQELDLLWKKRIVKYEDLNIKKFSL